MPERPTITTARFHGVEKGCFVVISGSTGSDKTYRVVDVPSPTTMVLDRPWWVPFAVAWGYVRRPFAWLRRLWWRVRYPT